MQAEDRDWLSPAIGLFLIAGLLLFAGGIKVASKARAHGPKTYPSRKPYLPAGAQAPTSPRRTPTKVSTQTQTQTTQPDTAPGADDRQILESDPDANSRAFAATSLATYRPVHTRTIKALIEALKDEDALVRSSAADTLGVLGRNARSARRALYDLRRDPDPEVRRAVKAALRKIR